jgi:chloramphenicol-sensitive protein RarD
MELLAWRAFAGVPLMLLLVALPPGISRIRKAMNNWKSVRILTLSTALIAINWFTFIYAVLNNRLMEASLGYFINPLVLVLLSRVFLREHLRPYQLLAIAIASVGVTVFACNMMFSATDAAISQFPWIALVLPVSFGLYGLLRKQMTADSVTGLAVEMLMILPLMIGLEIWMVISGNTIFMTGTPRLITLLMLSGLVTIVPLICFASAARRLRLTTVGLLQYIAPTCQFLLAFFLFNEPINAYKISAFILIWIAIIVYSTDSIRHARSMMKPATDG